MEVDGLPIPETDDNSATVAMASATSQTFHFQFNLTNLNLEAGVILVIDEDVLGSITLGSLLRSFNMIIPCLMK
jgi:hypothetical protein